MGLSELRRPAGLSFFGSDARARRVGVLVSPRARELIEQNAARDGECVR